MVGGMLGDVTDELSNLGTVNPAYKCAMLETHLDFLLEFTLEATPNNLPLTRLQPIYYRRNRTNIVRHREEN
jgi:transglutaminase-like putative cysteine protease